MNPDSSRLRHQHEHSQSTDLTQAQHQTVREFSSAEELIRYDAQQTEPPPAIADRLNESIRNEPKPPQSWWRRLFS